MALRLQAVMGYNTMTVFMIQQLEWTVCFTHCRVLLFIVSWAQLLQWFLIQLDEAQADSSARADWMARLGLWMPHLIYGCMKCRVRSFQRKNELPRGSKEVMVIVRPLVTAAETSLEMEGRRRNTWRNFALQLAECKTKLCESVWALYLLFLFGVI